MHTKNWLLIGLLLLLIGAALGACGGMASEEAPEFETAESDDEAIIAGEVVAVTRIVTEVIVEGEAAPAPGAVGALQPTPAATAAAPGEPGAPQQRLIIKDGRMVLTVVDTETAVTQATQLAVDLGGYIISQTLRDDDQGYLYATMRLAVPVNQFERALRDLRQLGDVTDESSSGEDVTDEFVDLNSRLTNLQATRDRLLEFLDQAETIDEVLEINAELTSVEEDIAVIQGRLNFLADRAAFSTIDLTLNPLLPTPTPSPTPTATPIPTPESWRPGDTAGTALVELQNTA
ncbi:MAG: DUF4349 domain-containing protein, partial [Anaerolineales bacterium]|nr:DUF4349 domain-containing protein [Anaerolineales bacterium]